LYHCSICDAKFQFPLIPENIVGKYYPDSTYHPFQLNSMPIKINSKYNPQSIYLQELMKSHKKDDVFSLIDIGCGGGTFLMSVKTYFPNARLAGVDVSAMAIENLKTIGIHGVCSSLYSFEVNKKFDYVISSQVLEHLNSPHLFLKKIKELSTDQTKIMIDVPATDSYSAKKYGRNWVHWDLPRHSILYSKKTLNHLFKDFKPIQIKHGGTIVALLSSYKLSKGENIYKQGPLEKFFVKFFSPIAKLLNINFLFSDKVIWIGRL
jgi:SAM-dependent methyltransferase